MGEQSRPRPAAAGLPAAPVVAFVVTAAATGYVAAVSPDRPGHYPVCPFLRVTGWWCPACGGLRCVHALTRGDLGTALHDNALLVLTGTLAVLWWARWTYRAAHGLRTPVPAPSRRWTWASIALLLAFAVLRNTPWGALLAPPRVPL